MLLARPARNLPASARIWAMRNGLGDVGPETAEGHVVRIVLRVGAATISSSLASALWLGRSKRSASGRCQSTSCASFQHRSGRA
jgi:hypothetical protein